MRARATWLSIISLLLTMVGCQDDPTVWKVDVPSPDGAWVATARTEQFGGFGSAYVDTRVTLRKLDGTVNRGKPVDVLAYPDGGPIKKAYVLSEENAGGGVNLTMRWKDRSHLEIGYNGQMNPNLQVVKFADVDIALQQK